MRKKALSPAARREEAQRLSASGLCSARAACRILELARSTYRYRGRPWQAPDFCTTCYERLGVGWGEALSCAGRGAAPTVARQRWANSDGVCSPNAECGLASL